MEDSPAYFPEGFKVLPSLQTRHVPDVPEDIDDDFVMEHLNDPNFDLRRRPRSQSHKGFDAHREIEGNFDYKNSDYDHESVVETDRYDSSRTGSRVPSVVEFDDQSSYPEVRSAVSIIDDPHMPVNTFRMWFLGLFFATLLSGSNQFFSMRYPSAFITGIVVQLVALPLGKGLAKVLPTTRFKTLGYTWSLNPGPFSIKEHVCIFVMANVAQNGPYTAALLATQRVFYHQSLTFSYQMCLTLGVQTFGFSLGGFLRRFVVWPASMIWPSTLVSSTLFNTLHKRGSRDYRHISREKFFLLVALASFVWYWIPGYLFTGLSMFSWICWIAPNNVPINALFGTVSGLGMGVLTFDWSMISYVSNPLATPWWSQMNTAASLVFHYWFLVPILYFTNAFFFSYLPISSYLSFDNSGNPYDPLKIVTNGTFDVEKYRQYSPVFLSSTLVMTYGVSFASFTSTFVHTFLWFRHDITRRLRSSLEDERDVHSRLMSAYKEVPDWWYASIAVCAFTLVSVTTHLFPTHLPIWAIFFGFLLASVITVPLAMIQAITNQQVSLNVIMELIAGYLVPGRPIANMIFKALGCITASQAIGFSGDLKLGHYMKIPPRIMYSVQLVASFVSCFVALLLQNWMFTHIEDLCLGTQKSGFICPQSSTLATSSLVWGGIGPKRLFSPGGLYNPMMYMFLVGAILPIPFYFLSRRSPLSFWRYINVPIAFAGVTSMPPASGINYSSWVMVGFIFNFCIRRYRFRWWSRYNYILSAGLDSGLGIGVVVIFFTLIYPKGGNGLVLNWWGNTVWTKTADANQTPYKILQPGQTFGPSTWT